MWPESVQWFRSFVMLWWAEGGSCGDVVQTAPNSPKHVQQTRSELQVRSLLVPSLLCSLCPHSRSSSKCCLVSVVKVPEQNYLPSFVAHANWP